MSIDEVNQYVNWLFLSFIFQFTSIRCQFQSESSIPKTITRINHKNIMKSCGKFQIQAAFIQLTTWSHHVCLSFRFSMPAYFLLLAWCSCWLWSWCFVWWLEFIQQRFIQSVSNDVEAENDTNNLRKVQKLVELISHEITQESRFVFFFVECCVVLFASLYSQPTISKDE